MKELRGKEGRNHFAYLLVILLGQWHAASAFQHGASGLPRSRFHQFSCTTALRGQSAPRAINVRVERVLTASPEASRSAWVSYQWKSGGGLPVIVWPKEQDSGQQYEGQRLVLPLMMEETLLAPDGDADEIQLRYAVTGSGLLASELVPESHVSRVRFLPLQGKAGCRMVWEVYFEASQRRWLWEAVTERMINDAADNLASHVAEPLLFSRRTSLGTAGDEAALDAWLSFVWQEGGGLPLPPPVLLPFSDGGSNAGAVTRLIVPPFLKERIVSVDRERCQVHYTVDNPGLLTYPVHSHIGRVTFADGSMQWDVEIRPLRGLRGFVQSFTETIITVLSRNFKSHVLEPGADVPLLPPRGAGAPLARVRKDSWVGGVLDAHLRDSRSTLEQTLALVQPSTWGRARDSDGDYASWSTGQLPDRTSWSRAER